MIGARLPEAESTAVRVRELLLDPAVGRLEQAQRELDRLVLLLASRPPLGAADHDSANRLLEELRAIAVLLTHCGAFYDGWLRISGSRTGGYTANGTAAPVEQRLRIRGEA